MADGFVRVSPDSTGKALDTSELTVSGNLVERERLVVGDNLINAFARVSPGSEFEISSNMELVLLSQILRELRQLNLTLANLGNVPLDGSSADDEALN